MPGHAHSFARAPAEFTFGVPAFRLHSDFMARPLTEQEDVDVEIPALLTTLKVCGEELARLRGGYDFELSRGVRPQSVAAVLRAGRHLGAELDAAARVIGRLSRTGGAQSDDEARVAAMEREIGVECNECARKLEGICIALRAWAEAADPEAEASRVLKEWVPVIGLNNKEQRELHIELARLLNGPVGAVPDGSIRMAVVELSGAAAVAARRVAAAACEAIELLGMHVSRFGRLQLRHDPAEFADDDKPRTEAEMAARSFWQSGNMWLATGSHMAGTKKDGREDHPVQGSGLWAEMVRATVGHNRRQHAQAVLAADPRFFGVKRRARTREFYRSPAKTPDYSRAFPDEMVRRLYDAVAFANRCGLVLNARVTVSWFLLEDCDAAECDRLFQRFKKNLVQWLGEKGPPEPGQPWPAFVYVHEAGDKAKYHTHMRVAVPPALAADFREEVRGALRKVIAPRPWPKLPKTKRGGSAEFVVSRVSGLAVHDPARRRPMTKDQWVSLGYLLKGADPRRVLMRREDGQLVTVGNLLEWEYEDPGAPWRGKPFSPSEALGPAARQRFRDKDGKPFVSLLERQIRDGNIDVRELYSDWYLAQALGRAAAEPNALINAEEADEGHDPLGPGWLGPGS